MSERPTEADFGYFFEIPTRWSDCDMLGHVNNARYFTFDESARLDYFAPLIGNDAAFWRKAGFILARIECDFIAQVHHPAQIRFGFRLRRIGRSSMNTEGGMFIDGKLVAVTRGVLVWFDYENAKAVSVPEHVKAFIRSRERIAPEEAS
ncbi:acyl-CoA thioesterase [Solimonas marina]|uniref:Acyl-CoA thioesterase n=1 Tax=Solimonas marina TaxID=2714601 RepID=A0A970B996_9GAMM|nr:thioesterase family protein [Solimonas marina]NKF23094.1 acyl-CoA thioesterase [Solimonas marina]